MNRNRKIITIAVLLISIAVLVKVFPDTSKMDQGQVKGIFFFYMTIIVVIALVLRRTLNSDRRQ